MHPNKSQNPLYDLFCASVEARKEEVAIIFEESRVTFGELKTTVEHTSALLDQVLLPTGSNWSKRKVLIHAPKRLETYAIWLACLRQGHAYAFADPSAPMERTKSIIDTLEPDLVISEEAIENAHGIAQTLAQFFEPIEDTAATVSPQVSHVGDTDLIYVMFTSGSTGKPKGVAIHSKGVQNLIEWSRSSVIPMIKPDGAPFGVTLSNINALHFDNSVFDLFCGLIAGNTIVSVDTVKTSNPAKWMELLRNGGAQSIFCVPTLFQTLDKLRLLREKYIPDVKLFMFGGEGFPVESLRKFYSDFENGARFLNVYGPTETSCICSSVEINVSSLNAASEESFPSIGRMHPGFKHMIRSMDGGVCAPNSVGELWIGGDNVGLGYFNDADKSRAAFCQNPAQSAYRDIWYRTGDLVRENPDGSLWFAGRSDNQIKFRGYRIELEEIDAALQRLPSVSRANSVKIDTNGAEMIAALFVADQKETSEKLAAACRKVLPGYMVPSHFFQLPKLPENGNGKVDRKALQQIAAQMVNEAQYA